MYYREEEIDGLTLLVPMYASRVDSRPRILEWEVTKKGKRPGYSVGWNIRFTRKDEACFRRYIKDSDFQLKGAKNKNGETRAQRAVRKSLNEVTSVIKCMLKNYRSHDEAKHDAVIDLSMNAKHNSDKTIMHGLNLIFLNNSTSDSITSPAINVMCKLGPSVKKGHLMSYTKTIYDWTPSNFNFAVKNVAIYRKYLERQNISGKKISKRSFDHLPLLSVKSLESAINSEDLPSFYDVVDLIEDNLGKPPKKMPNHISIERVNIDSKLGYRVKRNPYKNSRSLKEKVFLDDKYPTRKIAKMFAYWYGNQLTAYSSEYASKAGKPKGVRSNVKSRKTGVMGLTYLIRKPSNIMIWAAIIYPEDTSKRSKYRYFSASEHGFKEGFIKAWNCYLFNAGKTKESRTASLIRLNRMKPLLLKNLSQEVIDLYDLNTFFSRR